MNSILRYAYAKHSRVLLAAAGSTAATGCFFMTTSYAPTASLEEADESRNTANAPLFITRPKSKPLPTRQEQVSRLSNGQEFDVLVVGGGATGSGVALDAQMRGLNTALIERGDFSCETSSRSTKLSWAGIRYIATAMAQLLRVKTLLHPIDSIRDFYGEFTMVLGAHKERRLLLENNPHLTNWVPIAVPMKDWVQWPPPFGHPLFAICPLVFPGVMKFYDALSGFTCPPSHVMLKRRAQRKFPQLDEDCKYVQIFYEGQHNDARTNTCIALTAAEEGATVTNYTEMIDVLFGDNGKAVGIKCRDNMSGNEFEVRAKAIIFAGGPFTDGMRKLEDPDAEPAVAAAAGTHIVLPGYYSPAGIGLLDINTSDGRFLFFLPWQGSTLVGTTDRKGKVVSTPGPPEAEIQWLLNEAEKYLAEDLKVRRADVLSAWQGWRPLASDPNAPPGAPVSRDHIISTNPTTEITFITGGKWTTYREMAEDVVDRVVELKGLNTTGTCQTDKRPLRGGVGYTKNLPIQLVQQYGVSEETAKHLAYTYGTNAFDVCEMTKPTGKRWPRFGGLLIEGYPYLECEIEYACKHEMAVTLIDMLTLRTRLAYLNSEAAKEVAPKVADMMAKYLGWSRSEKMLQLKEAQDCLAEFGGPIPHDARARLAYYPTIHDIRSLFDMFDRDRNGYIDFEEMKIMAKELGSPFSSDKEAQRTFKRMDVNNNGRVSEEEFARWWHTTGKNDKLRRKLGEELKFSADKLGKGPKSRGVMFG